VALAAVLCTATQGCGGAQGRGASEHPLGGANGSGAPDGTRGGAAGDGGVADAVHDGRTAGGAAQVCGAEESFAWVSERACPDGSRPLAGDAGAGASARVRNVGEGSDGHVIDLFEVPCPGNAVRFYVDMYHCENGRRPYAL